LSKNLDTNDPLTIWQATTDLIHEIVHRLLIRARFETFGGDVSKSNPLPSIQPTQHPNLLRTERTIAIEEDFDRPVTL